MTVTSQWPDLSGTVFPVLSRSDRQKTGAAEEAEEVESRMISKRVAATDSQTQSVGSGGRRVGDKRELGAET